MQMLRQSMSDAKSESVYSYGLYSYGPIQPMSESKSDSVLKRIFVDVDEHVAHIQILCSIYRCLQVFTDIYRCLQIFTDAYRYLQILAGAYRCLQIFLNRRSSCRDSCRCV